MDNKIVLELYHGPNNGRNSEGSFITLADGRLLFIYARYATDGWQDHDPADLVARISTDDGKTWPEESKFVMMGNEGACNVMSPTFLRLQDARIAFFYGIKNSWMDFRLHMRTSTDECRTWSGSVLCIPAPGYFVVNNDRVIQLQTGRLVIPAAYHRAKQDSREMSWKGFDGRGIAMFFLSDDQGESWRESRDWWAFPGRSMSGLQEPGVIELADGRLYAWCRTDAGCQYEMMSEDQGETWSEPKPSRFISSTSPLSIKRIPETGELLAVWNDHSHLSSKEIAGLPKSSWGRTPLSVALSDDDGKTWSPARMIEIDENRGFCYTAIHFTQDAALLAYCCGPVGNGEAVLQDLCVRRVTFDWLKDKADS